MTNLSKNKDIVIEKSDKGNSVIIVDKETYNKRMENLFSDQTKFERVTLKNDALLNFVVNQEKRIDTVFKKLVHSISMSKEIYNQLKLGQVLCMRFVKYINKECVHSGLFCRPYRLSHAALLRFRSYIIYLN